MTELSPRNLLKVYRDKSPMVINEQADMLGQLTPLERDELLFYMITHSTQALQHLHAKIDPEETKTMGIDEIPGEKPN